MWRNPRSELLRFFDTRHPKSHRIYNLTCEPGEVLLAVVVCTVARAAAAVGPLSSLS
jgi:hypothetical protein